MKHLPTILLAAVATTSALFAQDHDVRAAPFNALRWTESTPSSPEIRLASDWYGWTAIDDVAVDDLIAFCKKEWPRKWKKRVAEDLVEALVLMEEEVGTEVKLTLIDLKTGKELEREQMPMTEANRSAVLAYNRGAHEVPAASKKPTIGAMAPKLVCKDLSGKTVSLEDLRGKTVIVDFWATWCAPCLREIPSLKEAHDNWSEKGLVILGVSTDEGDSAAAVKKLVKERKMPWTILHDAKAGNAAASAAWGISTIPQCFLIDGDGRIRAMGLRGEQVNFAVEQLITTGKVSMKGLPNPGEANRRGDWPKLSPFTAVKVKDGNYEVQLDGVWYRLASVEGYSAKSIMEHCEKQHGRKAEKRFAEDFVEVLGGLGVPVKDSVDLVLEALDGGERVVRTGVPMTEANRAAVYAARNSGFRGSGRIGTNEAAAASVERIERIHNTTAPPEFASLAKAVEWSGWDGKEILSRAQAERDLDQLEWLVEHTYSYTNLRGVDYRGAFDAVRSGLKEQVPSGAFATQVAQLLSLFGDGHTRIRGLELYQPSGYLPFLVADADGGVVAFKDDRKSLLDSKHPFLVSMDGMSVSEWLEIATSTRAMGSEQFVRFHGLRNLRMLNANRVAAGLEIHSKVRVVLANADGDERALELPVARRKPVYGPWPRTDAHTMLEGNIGYLRIPSMASQQGFTDGLVEGMSEFRETRGLIIDVRGNGGGSRHALNTLYPYFLAPDGGSRVVNIGAYRLRPGEERGRSEGYLENRFMYPAASTRWTDSERKAIEVTSKGFTPDWEPNPEKFSDWHYLVLSPGGEYHYDRPIVVLMDSGCFSATDIFLGAFADLPSAKLMGTPSGGGSGRSDGSVLAESGISVRLSSMASFRSTGQRYDGRGIEVDVLVEQTSEDYLEGGVDTALVAALKQLR